MTHRGLPARLARGHTRIAVRLLLFNVLLVFLPAAGVMYLDAYEEHLLEEQERAMIEVGRMAAAAIDAGALDSPENLARIARLAAATEARIRLVAPDGRVFADERSDSTGMSAPAYRGSVVDPEQRNSWLYRTGAWLARLWRDAAGRPTGLTSAEAIETAPGWIQAPEIARAATTGYGAATRLSPGGERSLTLYSALPVRASGTVPAVVLVSQTTGRLLERLYDVRLRIFEIVVASMCFAVVATAIVSVTIVRPLRQLRDDATAAAERRSSRWQFRGVGRRDEIGEVTRAVEHLTQRLDGHLQSSEQFAMDVVHELRNPLASIRASAEMLASAEAASDRERFRTRIERDIERLELLLTGLREATTVDARLEHDVRTRLDLAALLRDLVGERGMNVMLAVPAVPVYVAAAPERLAQVVLNLVDNAQSFSAPGMPVAVSLTRRSDHALLVVRDRGPGIAPEHLERIFERFFTHRPDHPQARQMHTGLGLSIARTIVRSYGGDITAANDAGGGARLEVSLPLDE
jgi:two-component system sensor histidine kinase ChvG